MRNIKEQWTVQINIISSIVGWEKNNKDETREILTEEGKN